MCGSAGWCAHAARHQGLWVVYEDRLVIDVPFLGRLYDAAQQTGAWSAGRINTALSCGLDPLFDFGAPATLAQGVWHWAADQPSGTGRCVAMDTVTGRWSARPCTDALVFACVGGGGNGYHQLAWSVSLARSAWTPTAGAAACAVGLAHGLPAASLSNSILRARAAGLGYSAVWLDYHRPGADWIPFYARDNGNVTGTNDATQPPDQMASPVMTVTSTPGTAPPIPVVNGAGLPSQIDNKQVYVNVISEPVFNQTDVFGNPATATRTNAVVFNPVNGLPITGTDGRFRKRVCCFVLRRRVCRQDWR